VKAARLEVAYLITLAVIKRETGGWRCMAIATHHVAVALGAG
jgi:hypothetical protein